MKKIQIYNINQFTKKGILKKNTVPEMGLAIAGGEDNEYIAKTIKQRGYHSFTSPYFFTHINALNPQGEQVIIKETVIIGIDKKEVVTTPLTLYKLLTK